MHKEMIPHLLPIFRFTDWECLIWNKNIASGPYSKQMRNAAILCDGTRTVEELKNLGIDIDIIQELVEKNYVVLVPSKKRKDPDERWCVISPHSDDAALSIGGMLAGLSKKVEVTILTMVGPSRCTGTCSPLYGDVAKVTQIRKAEDELYAALIGAKICCADLEDVEMYIDQDGSRWSERIMDYPDAFRLNLFASALTKYLTKLNPDIIIAPLAVGAHCDHATTHAALSSVLPIIRKGNSASKIYYYEDLPYCQFDKPALTRRLDELDRILPMEIAFNHIEKMRGISIYRSQYTISELDVELKSYAGSLSANAGVCIERLWQLKDRRL